MCLDVVFGSCCLPGMTVDAHIKHEVDIFPLQRQENACHFSHLFAVNFMHFLLTVSQEENGCNSLCETIISVKFVFCCRDLRFTSITVPTSSVLGMLEELRPSYLIHTSVQVFACWFTGILCKTHFHFSARSLQGFFFSRMCVCGELGLSVVHVRVQAV